MEQLFGAISFPNAERACGTVLRHAERTCCWRLPGALGCFKGAGGPHRTPALIAGGTVVPCTSASRAAGLGTRMEQFFPDMGFPGAERACGTVLRHLPWPVLRHLPWPVLRHLPWPVLRHLPWPVLRHLPWPVLRHLPWPVLRHLPWPVLRHLPWPVLRHLPWPVLRHAERNFFVRQHRLFDTPAPQPVAGRRHLPKRCFGSGCARPVATLKGAGEPHRTPALIAGFNAVPCTSAPGPGAETANEASSGEAIAHGN